MSLRADIVTALRSIGALGDRVYDDRVPDGVRRPYASVIGWIDESMAASGDGRAIATRSIHQVDIWESGPQERPDLADEVWQALDGLPLDGGFHAKVQGVVRLYEPDYDLIHRAFTISVSRAV